MCGPMKYLFSPLSALGVASVIALTGTSALAAENFPSRDELLKMLQTQQRQLNELQDMLKQTKSKVQKVEKEASSSILDTIKIGGALEFEATSSETYAGVGSSDLSLAKAELSFAAQPHKYVAANIVALYEDGSNNITLDEATITLANIDEFPLYAQVGKWAVPFGNYDTAMSSDPITLTVGETKEDALLVGLTSAGFTLEGFVYNGDTQKTGEEDQIDQYGLNLGYSGEVSGVGFALGAGYLNNIADSDGVNDKLTGGTSLRKYVGGVALNGSITTGDVTFSGGYVKAQDKFQSGELAFNSLGAQPVAWNTEIAYTTEILGKETTFAATYQGSDEALALELPERRLGAAVTVGIYDNTALSLEYLNDEDYGTADGGTGNDKHTAIAKLAVEF